MSKQWKSSAELKDFLASIAKGVLSGKIRTDRGDVAIKAGAHWLSALRHDLSVFRENRKAGRPADAGIPSCKSE